MVLFSQRYHRTLQQGRLTVEISSDLRRKAWTQLRAHNSTFYVQRDPTDNWQDQTTALDEAESDLMTEHGWECIAGAPVNTAEYLPGLRHLVLSGAAAFVLDAIELAFGHMQSEDREPFKNKINTAFELQDCPWRLSDGEFFKLDSDFMGARIAASAHDGLAANLTASEIASHILGICGRSKGIAVGRGRARRSADDAWWRLSWGRGAAA